MKKISHEEFWEDWEKGLIQEVCSDGAYCYGKSVRGQGGNPQGFITVYAKVDKPKQEKTLLQRLKTAIHL